MRVKTISAPSVKEALHTVKQTLGDDAIILSTIEDAQGVTVTVGINTQPLPTDVVPQTAAQQYPHVFAELHEQLLRHGVPASMLDQWWALIAPTSMRNSHTALTSVLSRLIDYAPIKPATGQRFMLMGMSGVGKTVSIAKLALMYKMHQVPVSLVTTDVDKRGAIDQLAGYSEVLGLPLTVLHTPELMSFELQRIPSAHAILIDTSGLNPYADDDWKKLAELKQLTQAEPILVLPAGHDVWEASELTQRFRLQLHGQKLIISRLDTARRYASWLMAATSAPMGLTHLSGSANIGAGWLPASAELLTKLLLTAADDVPHLFEGFRK